MIMFYYICCAHHEWEFCFHKKKTTLHKQKANYSLRENRQDEMPRHKLQTNYQVHIVINLVFSQWDQLPQFLQENFLWVL